MSAVAHVPLGEIATIIAGQSPPSHSYNEAADGLPFFQGKADFGDVHPVARKWCTEPKKIAESGDILISVRAPVGPTNIAKERCCIGRGLAAIRPDNKIVCRDFVHWAIIHRHDEIVAKGRGSIFASIDQSDLRSISIPLMPRRKQEKIADILNSASHIQRLCRRAYDCPHNFAQTLFIKMFGDPVENPMGWETRRLDEIADLSAGDPAPQDPEAFAPDGPLFVRMQDVGRDHVNPELAESTDRLDPAWLRENRLRVFPRDSLLIPKSGVSVNLNHRAMLAVDAHVVSHLAIAAPHRSVVDPVYLFWWSVHYDPREHAQVTTLPSLKLSVLRQAEVPLPPLDLQQRFAAIAKGAARMSSRAKAAAGAAAALAEALAARLLEQAP